MENEICKEYVETNTGIEALALKYHMGKLKIKRILSDNGIEIKKKGNQKLKGVLVVPDWRIEKYEELDGKEYIVYDPNTTFESKDIRNDGGMLTSYLKTAYGLSIPSLYDRRMYYMKTGNYWWEQWLKVKTVPCGSVRIKRDKWESVGIVEDNIGNVVSNRIRDAVQKKTTNKVHKVETTVNGVKKTKNEIFAEKGHLAHPGENIDYNKVDYVNKSTPVCIIDHDLRPDGTEYGEYWQRPENHLRGSGHPDKARDRIKEQLSFKWDELVLRFKEAHAGENIEYPHQENYVNLNSKIRFIDHDIMPDGSEYGEVWQVAAEHLKGRKHPAKFHDSRRGMMAKNRKCEEDFKNDCEKVWGDKYILDEIHYEGRRKTVTPKCKIHGKFEITAENFIAGHGCPKCGNVHHYNNEEFKERIHKIHGDKYITDKVNYINAKTKVCLICQKHGEFWITPNKLLNGEGCYECGRERIYDSLRMTRDEVVEKAKLVHNNRYTYEHFLEYKNNTSPITATCPIHGDFTQTVASHLAGCGCPQCFSTRSKAESDIHDYVRSLKFATVQNNRELLNGLEVDIYVPNKKIGIEFNGLYWHTEEMGKDRNYHINKTVLADKAGIGLVQIFEDEWDEHKDIVLSKIRHILGVDENRIKIGARKCTVGTISGEVAKTFLTKWHIQGYVKSGLYYGAFYDDILVSVMCFKHYSEKDEWELTRFATNGDYSIPGIGGKLFKHFILDKNPSIVKSFADRRWTLDKANNLYTKLGFKLDEIERPDYRYVVGNKRKHKFGFRKQILNKKYGVPLEWTEKEMCDTLGFYRIWDCGLFKYVWRKETPSI